MDCLDCAHWFLGCLNRRSKWKDKAIMPNYRMVGQSGVEYSVDIPDSEYPLRGFCDDFYRDPDPERNGRVVWI